MFKEQIDVFRKEMRLETHVYLEIDMDPYDLI